MEDINKDDSASPNANFVIVGAGLVGCLASVYLSKLGFKVNVYEYREDIRKNVQTRGKSINLALSHRGLEALKNADIALADFTHMLVPMKGRMIHKRNANCEALMYDVKYQRHIYSIGRNELNKMLLNEAEKKGVKFNFRCKVVKVDFQKKILNISQQSSNEDKPQEVKYDYLIGCDGAYSTIRHCMMRTPLFNFSQTYIDHGYMELSIPVNAQQSEKNKMTPNHLHIWPRVTFMMIALPNEDGSWTVTLFMPFEQFGKIKNRHDLLDFFGQHFADALPLIGHQNLIETFFSSTPQPLVSIKCDKYTVGNDCLIMGDAAHAVVPFFGQGMNAGFEDCQILYEILKHEPSSKAFESFSKKRIIDTHAISNLSMYNYLEMRNLVVSKRFLLLKKLDNMLYKYLWSEMWKPLYVHVTFSSTPYSRCLQIQKFQRQVLNAFGFAIVILLGLLVLGIKFS
ncbi:kynurenine 3-monooxygenase [Planococcus citri]|uniref:kynurenine 3-monooxygenase n=1 Tax=Planococcus citri TaxID=170843 RepID=UPI0031F97974